MDLATGKRYNLKLCFFTIRADGGGERSLDTGKCNFRVTSVSAEADGARVEVYSALDDIATADW